MDNSTIKHKDPVQTAIMTKKLKFKCPRCHLPVTKQKPLNKNYLCKDKKSQNNCLICSSNGEI